MGEMKKIMINIKSKYKFKYTIHYKKINLSKFSFHKIGTRNLESAITSEYSVNIFFLLSNKFYFFSTKKIKIKNFYCQSKIFQFFFSGKRNRK